MEDKCSREHQHQARSEKILFPTALFCPTEKDIVPMTSYALTLDVSLVGLALEDTDPAPVRYIQTPPYAAIAARKGGDARSDGDSLPTIRRFVPIHDDKDLTSCSRARYLQHSLTAILSHCNTFLTQHSSHLITLLMSTLFSLPIAHCSTTSHFNTLLTSTGCTLSHLLQHSSHCNSLVTSTFFSLQLDLPCSSSCREDEALLVSLMEKCQQGFNKRQKPVLASESSGGTLPSLAS